MNTNTRTTRRLFFAKAGAVAAAPVAAVTGYAADEKPGDSAARERLALLEDVNAIRALQQSLLRHVNARSLEYARELFVGDAALELGAGIRSLLPDAIGEAEAIEVSADRKSAIASLHCQAVVETAIGPSCTLVEMARAQGEGVLRHAAHGVLETRFAKREGVWKIAAAGYRA